MLLWISYAAGVPSPGAAVESVAVNTETTLELASHIEWHYPAWPEMPADVRRRALEITRRISLVAACCSRASQVFLRLGEFTGPLIELLLQVGCRGTATARSRRHLAALDLRCLTAARLHCYAARCRAGLASGHATNAIDVTNRHPLMKPSYDAQDHARGRKGTTRRGP